MFSLRHFVKTKFFLPFDYFWLWTFYSLNYQNQFVPIPFFMNVLFAKWPESSCSHTCFYERLIRWMTRISLFSYFFLWTSYSLNDQNQFIPILVFMNVLFAEWPESVCSHSSFYERLIRWMTRINMFPYFFFMNVLFAEWPESICSHTFFYEVLFAEWPESICSHTFFTYWRIDNPPEGLLH